MARRMVEDSCKVDQTPSPAQAGPVRTGGVSDSGVDQSLPACRTVAKPDIANGSAMIMPDAYKSIAVASTFSPRFLHVLSEANRIRDRFGSDLSLIYVGEKDEQTTSKFSEVLAQLGMPADSVVHYGKGDPASVILQTVQEKKIDMIVAGALEKEVVLHPFLGNVARRLVREACCSVMLFTHPQKKPKPLRRIVFIADDSQQRLAAFKTTLMLAEAESCERLYVIGINTAFDEARASIAGDATGSATQKQKDREEDGLEEFVLSAGATEVPIETRFIRGATSLAASDFVRSVEADLLVVPLPKNRETV